MFVRNIGGPDKAELSHLGVKRISFLIAIFCHFTIKQTVNERHSKSVTWLYGHAPNNDVLVNDGSEIRRWWSHGIIIL